MKIHEYQAKELFRKYGVATPRGFACFLSKVLYRKHIPCHVVLFAAKLLKNIIGLFFFFIDASSERNNQCNKHRQRNNDE